VPVTTRASRLACRRAAKVPRFVLVREHLGNPGLMYRLTPERNGMVRNFDHVTIVVRDVEAAKRFFAFLGFKEVKV
jgi:hypothetical protein